MSMSVRARLGAAAVAATAASLLAPTSAPALQAPAAAPPPSADSARASVPTLDFKITGTGELRKVRGPSSFRGGRVNFKVTGAGEGGVLEFVKLAKGYTFSDLRADFKRMFDGDFSKWDRLMRKTTFLGGAAASGGQTSRGTVNLPKGRVIAFNDSGLPKSPLALKVGAWQKRPAVETTGVIKALDDNRFGGSSQMPRRGKLKWTNKSTDSPHFVEVIRVSPGTTKQDIIDYFQSESEDPPPWFEGEAFMAGTVDPGKKMTLNYAQPAGRYAAFCWIPDPDMGGMPHALMGMIKVFDLV